MRENKDGKSRTITINITEELRGRIEALRSENVAFSNMLFSQFLAYLVGVGIKEEELRNIEEQERVKARIEVAKNTINPNINR
jgi:GTP-sensing pleiotropic transcriptional regulator CodY